MRQALNENPVVQAAVIGGLLLVGVIFFAMNVMGGGGSGAGSSTTPTTPAVAATPGSTAPAAPSGSATTAPGTTGSTAVTGGTGVTGATSAPTANTGGSVDPQALVPGPGLPADVIKAWSGGNAVVLLIVRPSGIDDKLVRGASRVLNASTRVTLFVVRANKIARYSRITQGVGVDRVPALVVVRPRRKGTSVPQAEVSYGFRSAQGVVQAVRDAAYRGRDNLPYYPG
jgi:hypothetical protein